MPRSARPSRLEPFQDVELREEEEPLGDRRGLVHRVAAVVRGDRPVDERLVELAREVARLEQGALPPEEGEELLAKLAPVEGVGAAVGDDAKAPREIGRRPALPGRGRPAAGQEQPCRIREAPEDVGPVADPPVDPGRDGHPFLGQPDGGRPELRPTGYCPSASRSSRRRRPRRGCRRSGRPRAASGGGPGSGSSRGSRPRRRPRSRSGRGAPAGGRRRGPRTRRRRGRTSSGAGPPPPRRRRSLRRRHCPPDPGPELRPARLEDERSTPCREARGLPRTARTRRQSTARRRR